MNDIDKKKSMEGGMEIFARASNYLGDIAKSALANDGSKEECAMIIPSIVLKGLACEIGLKTLLKIEGKNIEREHKLKTLYQQLEEGHRCEISQVLLVSMTKVDEDYNEEKLNENLNEINKAFIDWRYFYEKSQHVGVTFLEEFYKSIQMIVYSAMQENE